MVKSRRVINSLFVPVMMLVVSSYTAAQLVASKDLTETPPPPPTSSQSSSPVPSAAPASKGAQEAVCFETISDGAIVKEVPEKLQLEIVSADPRLVYDGTPTVVTVRLKNVGDHSVLVPWETQPVEPETDSKTQITYYESANISLMLGTLDNRKRGGILKGGATLVATPSTHAQHVELSPGQWVDVKFKTVIECSLTESWACPVFHADPHAQLTASWNEWLFTHEGDRCRGTDGAFKSRAIESVPLEIVYVASSHSDEQKSAPSK